METDREVLIWFHQRLVRTYHERELYDYMHRLRQIILATPPRKKSRKGTSNSMADLYPQLKNKSYIEKEWKNDLVSRD